MSNAGRVRWTADEQELVTEAMAERLRAVPATRAAALWEAGNALLAPDRQRKWYSSYSGKASAAGPLFAEARKRAQGPPQATQHVPMQEAVPITWVPVPTMQPLSEVPLKELIAEVVERIMYALTPQAPQSTRSETITRNMATLQQSLPKLTPDSRPVRIALCGPMADQFRRVKERINARKVELVWVDNQKGVTSQDFGGGLDHVIVTRFIRHSHTELAQKAVGKQRVWWTSQGTEAIVATVCEVVPGASN